MGLIGIGLVGSALAERWHSAGWQTVGFDLDPQKRQFLQNLVGRVAGSIEEVARSAEVIVLSLPTSEIAASVVASILDMLAGKIVVDTTTGEPDEMIAIGAAVAQRDGEYLDATIAGSSAQVRSGEAIVIAGGLAQTVATVDPLLRTFATQVFHVGPCGAGARMKLVVNLVLGLNRAVLAEGLSFARRCGIDPSQALEVLRAGPAFSQVMTIKGTKMLEGDFTPQARLAQHLKDVRLILSAGMIHGATLPLSTLHAELLDPLASSLIRRSKQILRNSLCLKGTRT